MSYQSLAARYALQSSHIEDLAQEAAIAAWRHPAHPHKAAQYRVRQLCYLPHPHRQLGGWSVRGPRMVSLDSIADLPYRGDELENAELHADLKAALDALPNHLRAYIERRFFTVRGELFGPKSHKYEASALKFLRERMSVNG